MASVTSLTGAAGEHFVMSELLRRGYIAALAPAGAPNCDIIVSDIDAQQLAAIQVKTRNNSGADGGWHMSAKHETISSSALFYCFVDFRFGQSREPVTYVLPASKVANILRISHQAWLAKPGRGGRPHKDGSMRRFLPSYEHLGLHSYKEGWLKDFENAWSIIETPPQADGD